MLSRKTSVAILLFLAGVSAAIACGPFFPWQLLDDRRTTLKETPHNSFVYEASHLVAPPNDRLRRYETQYYDTQQSADELRKIETASLTTAQGDHLDVMRKVTDNDEDAFAAGGGLPDAVRLYTTGAIDFKATRLDEAAKRFDEVLALPPAARRLRATWAGYMAGRTAAVANGNAKAAAMFQLTRRLADEGQPDPLGLGVASFGEEAKLHYERANDLLFRDTSPNAASGGAPTARSIPEDPRFVGYSLQAGKSATYRAEMVAASRLYAEQAAHGSNSGVQSLRIVAENLLESPERIAAVISDPLLERLLVDYVLARIPDDPGHDAGLNDAGMGPADPTPSPVLPVLVETIVKSGGPRPAGADRLAALSYHVGRYDLAANLANTTATPLAEWVKAKLALQQGDLADAARHYAAAAKGFPGSTNSLDPENANLVAGESGALELARGDYVDALDKLYPVASTYWGDVAYIAERVLTTDELRSFVDAKTTAPRSVSPNDLGYGAPANPALQLRALLARRLMRDGRYAAALSYFGDPALRAKAARYAEALHEGETDWFPVNRANAYFTAAKLARLFGIDILGTEAAPDFYDLGGSFDSGIGQDKPTGAYVTAAERARAAASTAKPDLRFHYRYLAVDEVSAAADLLPQRSQAFAAVLCRASGWMLQTPGENARALSLYHRYLKQGAHVSWATHFGRNCPEPDFARASSLQHRQLYRHWRRTASLHRWWIAAIAALIAAMGVAVVAVTRRRRKI